MRPPVASCRAGARSLGGGRVHELGIVFYIIDDAKKAATDNGLTSVRRVTLDLGEVSGVVPDLLQDAWTWACRREPMMEGCELEVCEKEAASVCEACGTEYGTVAYGRICPACGSERTHLLHGREVMIREIEAY